MVHFAKSNYSILTIKCAVNLAKLSLGPWWCKTSSITGSITWLRIQPLSRFKLTTGSGARDPISVMLHLLRVQVLLLFWMVRHLPCKLTSTPNTWQQQHLLMLVTKVCRLSRSVCSANICRLSTRIVVWPSRQNGKTFQAVVHSTQPWPQTISTTPCTTPTTTTLAAHCTEVWTALATRTTLHSVLVMIYIIRKHHITCCARLKTKLFILSRRFTMTTGIY